MMVLMMVVLMMVVLMVLGPILKKRMRRMRRMRHAAVVLWNHLLMRL